MDVLALTVALKAPGVTLGYFQPQAGFVHWVVRLALALDVISILLSPTLFRDKSRQEIVPSRFGTGTCSLLMASHTELVDTYPVLNAEGVPPRKGDTGRRTAHNYTDTFAACSLVETERSRTFGGGYSRDEAKQLHAIGWRDLPGGAWG